MENSVVFTVNSSEDSEDEEDDIQRKEELHQLLSEQLQDDLLDDSFSTSVDGEISIVSSEQVSYRDPNEPNSDDDATLNASIATPSPSEHMFQSHDNHMITSPDHPVPTSSPPKARTSPVVQALQPTSPVPITTTDYPDTLVSTQVTGYLMPLQTNTVGPTHISHSLTHHQAFQAGEHFDLFAGTSQAYNSSAVLDSVETGGSLTIEEHNNSVVTHGGIDEPAGNIENPQSKEMIPTQFHRLEHDQQYLATSSTAHNNPLYPDSNQHQPHSFPLINSEQPPYMNELLVSEVQNTDIHGERHPQQTLHHSVDHHCSPHRYGGPADLRHLEVLHKAQGRRIAELTQQMAFQADDAERHVRILRHEKVLVENERDQLSTHVQELESIQQTLEREVGALQGRLTAEQTKSRALENNKKELTSRLHASEATVESITQQVNDLTSSDAIGRVRENYSSALAQSSQQQQQERIEFEEEMEEARQQLENKDETISKLQQELHDLHAQYQTQLSTKEQEVNSLKQKTHQKGSASQGNSIIQQLDFGGCDGGEGVRIVELATQVEDLIFQLNTTQEELLAALERTQQTEGALVEQAGQISELLKEKEQLLTHISELESNIEENRSSIEEEKRAALEQCRSACLKLHEESTQRLKDSVSTEKSRVVQEQKREITQIKEDLATVQEQYVSVCGEREQLQRRMEEIEKRREISIQEALDKARLQWSIDKDEAVQEAVSAAKMEWRGKLMEESRNSVEQALSEQRKNWEDRLESEKSKAVLAAKEQFTKELTDTKQHMSEQHVKEIMKLKSHHEAESGSVEAAMNRARENREREKLVSMEDAVRKARVKWLKEEEVSIKTRVDSAVSAAQRLWNQHHREELTRLREELRSSAGNKDPSSSSSASSSVSVGAVIKHARSQWEKEHEKRLSDAIRQTRQECENEVAVKLELALASQREKIQEECSKELKQRQSTFLTTAHQEWSKAQKVVVAAEIEHLKRKWKEEQERKMKVTLEEGLSQAKQYYDDLLSSQKTEVAMKYKEEKTQMSREIQQLEERVAILMQQQQHQQNVENIISLSSHLQGAVIKDGGGTCVQIDLDRLREVLQATMIAVKNDVTALLCEVQKSREAQHQRQLEHVRESTARELKQYYLQCLHQLVNANGHRPHPLLKDTSHDHHRPHPLSNATKPTKEHSSVKQSKPQGSKTAHSAHRSVTSQPVTINSASNSRHLQPSKLLVSHSSKSTHQHQAGYMKPTIASIKHDHTPQQQQQQQKKRTSSGGSGKSNQKSTNQTVLTTGGVGSSGWSTYGGHGGGLKRNLFGT